MVREPWWRLGVVKDVRGHLVKEKLLGGMGIRGVVKGDEVVMGPKGCGPWLGEKAIGQEGCWSKVMMQRM